jgi:hypothetical protein
MKQFLAVLITAVISLVLGQAPAATLSFPDQSIDSLNSSLVCEKDKDKDKDKKKKKITLPEEEEPECD